MGIAQEQEFGFIDLEKVNLSIIREMQQALENVEAKSGDLKNSFARIMKDVPQQENSKNARIMYNLMTIASLKQRIKGLNEALVRVAAAQKPAIATLQAAVVFNR